MNPNKKIKKTDGIPTRKIVLPIAIILVILHLVIVSSIFLISQASGEMTSIMQTYSGYISDVVDLQGGSSFLSETSTSFLLRPTLESGRLNSTPLFAYANELQRPRRGADIQKRFEGKEIDAEILQKIDVAAESTSTMMEIQLHAIALTLSTYPASELSDLPPLPHPALTEEENAMTNEQKLARSVELIAGKEYSDHKKIVSDNVSIINRTFQIKMQDRSIVQLKKVNFFRTLLWITTILVIDILLVSFVLLIRLLVYPLRGFVHGINKGTKIRENQGLAEVRLVARSYNELLEKKTSFENVLRSVAETDALTDLPNRYCMEQYLMLKEEEDISIAFFLFDVNFLKKTNDREGHLAGDALLKRAAHCISTCFESFPDAKCFRYGGDEFTAIVKNCHEDEIREVLARLEKEEKNSNVSMAIGYAYAPDIGKTSIKALFSDADKKMYEHKKLIHDRASEEKNP